MTNQKDPQEQYDALCNSIQILNLAKNVRYSHPDVCRDLRKQAEYLARFAADGLRASVREGLTPAMEIMMQEK